MERRDVATWISGPREALAAAGIEVGYRGKQLGLPEAGVGSVTGFGRRLAALFIDWIACVLIAALFTRLPYGSMGLSFASLAVFFIVKSAFTVLGGSSFGQRLVGNRVITIGGKPYINPVRAVVRSLLICLVVPAAIWDRDGRGLQDKVAHTVEVRTR